MVNVRNTISGQIADISPKLLEHPVFGQYLEVVEIDAKPFVAELYKSGTKQEKAARKPKFVDEVDVFEEAVVEEPVIPTIQEDN